MNNYYLSLSVLILILSLIFYFFKPKKMNSFYGYRTKRSKKSQSHWVIANKMASKYFLLTSLSLVSGTLINKYFQIIPQVYLFITIMCFGLIIMFINVEKKLKEMK